MIEVDEQVQEVAVEESEEQKAKKAIDRRRVRRVLIPYDEALRLFSGKSRIVNLGEGCEVVSVHDDYQYQSLAFIVRCPSFDPVAPGYVIPTYDGLLVTEVRGETL